MTEHTTRGPYRTGIRRRQQIVTAAAEVFAARGYDGASLRQIAADAGISPPALLRHFENKEDLLAAVLEWWSAQTAAITNDGDTGLAVFARLGEVMRYHTRNRGLLELFIRLTGEATHQGHPARSFVQNRYAHLVKTLVERLLAAVDAGEVAPVSRPRAEAEVRALCAVMDGLEIQWLLNPELDLAGLFDQHLAITLDRWQTGAGQRGE